MSEETAKPSLIRPILLIGSGVSEVSVNQVLAEMGRQDCEVCQSAVLEPDQVVLIGEEAQRGFLFKEPPPLKLECIDFLNQAQPTLYDPPRFNGYMGRRRKR